MLPTLLPLGDRALLIRFADSLSEAGNAAAIGFGRRAAVAELPGVVEVVPSLVSVLLRYDPGVIGFDRLAGEVRLLLSGPPEAPAEGASHAIPVRFDGEDLDAVAHALGMSPAAFVVAHNEMPLRVLATGFAPGFVYCGFHAAGLHVARREVVRPRVPGGTVLFAAGQTAITSTPIPTGWHVIGHTSFRNLDLSAEPPTHLAAGDRVRFEAAA